MGGCLKQWKCLPSQFWGEKSEIKALEGLWGLEQKTPPASSSSWGSGCPRVWRCRSSPCLCLYPIFSLVLSCLFQGHWSLDSRPTQVIQKDLISRSFISSHVQRPFVLVRSHSQGPGCGRSLPGDPCSPPRMVCCRLRHPTSEDNGSWGFSGGPSGSMAGLYSVLHQRPEGAGRQSHRLCLRFPARAPGS